MDDKFKAIEVTTRDGLRGTMYINHFGESRDPELTKEEKELAVRSIEGLLKSGVNKKYIGIERKSNNYATIVIVGERPVDLIRFKYGARAKWIAVPLTRDDAKSNVDNPLFTAQKNKKQLMWKANISSISDVDKFIPFVLNRIRFIQSASKGALDNVLTS